MAELFVARGVRSAAVEVRQRWDDLPEAEKALLVSQLLPNRQPIAHDDSTAISTKSGWALYQKMRRERLGPDWPPEGYLRTQ